MLTTIQRQGAMLVLTVIFTMPVAWADAPSADLDMNAAAEHLISNAGGDPAMLQWARERASRFRLDQSGLKAEMARIRQEISSAKTRLSEGPGFNVLWNYIESLSAEERVLKDFSLPQELVGQAEAEWQDLVAIHSAETYLYELRSRDMGRMDDANFCVEARDALLAMTYYFKNTVEDLQLESVITGRDLEGAVALTILETGVNLTNYCMQESDSAGIVTSRMRDGKTISMQLQSEVTSPFHNLPAIFEFSLSRGPVGANADAIMADYGWTPKITGTIIEEDATQEHDNGILRAE